MRPKNLLLPAAVLIAVMAFLASHANAQTMGEYATTTAGVGTGSGSMGTAFKLPSLTGSNGEGSQTWGVSGTGGSWSDRAGAAGGDFESRAGSASSGAATQARWPETGLSNAQGLSFGSSKLDEGGDRFSGSDRFPAHDFSSASRWPASSLSDSKSGLDTSFNSVSGN